MNAAEATMEIKTSEIRPGDFLDQINPATLRGPRGGKYRFDGVRVGSRVVRCGFRDSASRASGFEIVPSTGVAFVVPGNAADLTTAVVRRKAETEVVRFLDDDELLAASESDDRATKLAALAELDARTSETLPPTSLDRILRSA